MTHPRTTIPTVLSAFSAFRSSRSLCISVSPSPHIPSSSTLQAEPNPLKMAVQADSPAGSPSAQIVGNAFVEQYYQILHQSPEQVFRFYQDSSVLSRPDGNGVMTSVTTMQGINEKIISLNYKDYMAEIKTADAQLYVEGNEPAVKTPISVSALGESTPATPPVPDPVQSTQVPEDPITVLETSEEDQSDGAEVYDPSDNEGSVVEDEVVSEPPVNPNQSENIVVESSPSIPEGDAPKKSYASIVKYRKANPTPTKTHVSANDIRASPSKSEQQTGEPAKSVPIPETIVSTVEIPPESNNVQNEGHSIYVRNLPLNATAAQLEQVFNSFGSIKQGGVQVRSNKQGFCYGFVEFESEASMIIGMNTNGGGGRGRYGPPGGRGGGYRTDNFRGRGGGGPRSYSRGEYVARNRRAPETYQRVDHNGSGRGGGGNYEQQGGAK
ncbi:hypothetical protein V2J09_014916 [Rumex salicifolius]